MLMEASDKTMLIKRLLLTMLITISYATVADTELLAFYTDVESFSEAQNRLDKQDVMTSELIRTPYLVEKDLDSLKVIIRPR